MSTSRYVSKESEVVDFLKSHVPKSDVPNIETELKKDFLLAKKRGKRLKRKKKTKKSITLTRKEKKQLGFYSIPRNSVNYQDVLPMHNIWLDYMSQMLELEKPIPECGSKGWESFTQTVYKADFHGSKLQVLRSKCPSYVGKGGICIMDTKNTFKIVSKDNVVTTIPKKDSVFVMSVRNLRLTLFGKLFVVRPAERTKKLKSNFHPDL